MTKILFVRHGYSEANRLQMYAGSGVDSPLTEQGQAQGDTVSAFIAENYHVDKIISSPLSRAKNTIRLLAEKTGLPIETEEGFKEIYGGKWEGRAHQDNAKDYPKEFAVWKKDYGNCHPPEGESFASLQERMLKTAEKTARENDGKTVVVATHAGALRALFSAFKNIPNEDVQLKTTWVPNASISTVEYENGKWALVSEGEVGHLGDNVTRVDFSNIK